MNRFFQFFERFARPFERADVQISHPPAGGMAFIWHFARQMKGAFFLMLLLGGLHALVEASIFMFVGLIVDMMNTSSRESFFNDHGTTLWVMAGLVLIIRSLIAVGTAVLEEQVVVPGFFTLVRWQGHKVVSQQDVSFFDDEMAGRISSKVWQTGQAAGDAIISLLQIIWFIAVFSFTSLLVIGRLDGMIMMIVLVWIIAILSIAAVAVPKIRDRGRAAAEANAVVTGRIVDGYSHMRTVKLYSAEGNQDAFIRQAWDKMLEVMFLFTRSIAGMRISSQILSSFMLVAITALSLYLFSQHVLSVGEVAVILTLSLRLNLLFGRLLGLLNGLFRNFGTVQNSAAMLSKKPVISDKEEAHDLVLSQGHVAFKALNFAYTRDHLVLNGLNLDIAAGQKLGVVGHSGVGKTTLSNLLLRFHEVEDGAITIDGHDIRDIKQNALRAAIGVVTQDNSLLHRSIKDNIAFGQEQATQEQIEQAAKRAKAHDFIVNLADEQGRSGYDTHVGERGVKLSGGQKQRIAIARVFLKNAPILLLDEATSALDSEVEAIIQENLSALMENKTVIAIAHRLSTLMHLDRLVVIDQGRVVEDGSHEELLAKGGIYAHLWHRQTNASSLSIG